MPRDRPGPYDVAIVGFGPTGAALANLMGLLRIAGRGSGWWSNLLLHGDRPDLGDFTIQYCHPQTPATYVRGPGLRRRWEIFIADLPDAQALEPANIWRRLARWLTRLPRQRSSGRRSIPSTRSSQHPGVRARLLIAGDAATRPRPSWARACARGSGMRRIWLGSSPTASATGTMTRCSTATRASAILMSGPSSSARSVLAGWSMRRTARRR